MENEPLRQPILSQIDTVMIADTEGMASHHHRRISVSKTCEKPASSYLCAVLQCLKIHPLKNFQYKVSGSLVFICFI